MISRMLIVLWLVFAALAAPFVLDAVMKVSTR